MKQDPFSVTRRASTPEELAEMFMNPNTPKTEAEHWAVREIERQRAEIEQLQRSFDDGYLMLEATQQVNDKLRSKNEWLREALRWYADPLNHSPVKCRFPGDPDPSVVFLMELPPIINDGGHRARRALDLEDGS